MDQTDAADQPNTLVEVMRTDPDRLTEREVARRRAEKGHKLSMSMGCCKAFLFQLLCLVFLSLGYLCLPLILSNLRAEGMTQHQREAGAAVMASERYGFRDVLVGMTPHFHQAMNLPVVYSAMTFAVWLYHGACVVAWGHRFMSGYSRMAWFMFLLLGFSLCANLLVWTPPDDDVLQMEGEAPGALFGIAQPMAHTMVSERLALCLVMSYLQLLRYFDKLATTRHEPVVVVIGLVMWAAVACLVMFYTFATHQLRGSAVITSLVVGPAIYSASNVFYKRSAGTYDWENEEEDDETSDDGEPTTEDVAKRIAMRMTSALRYQTDEAHTEEQTDELTAVRLDQPTMQDPEKAGRRHTEDSNGFSSA